MTGVQIADAVIRVQALDGTWETVGVDRLAGIVPENITCTANEWGPEKASFDLRRDPGGIYPDLTAFTPVDIEVGGTKVWAGRVSSTPSRDGSDSVVNVQCEGWQYHLDDDSYERKYVINSLGGFEDMRTFRDLLLSGCAGSGLTQNDSNGLYITFPPGVPATNGKVVGMMIDLGPYTTAQRVVATWTAWGVDANVNLYCRATADPSLLFTTYSDAFAPTFTTGPTTTAGTFGTPARYVCLMIYRNGITATPGEPGLFARISDVKLFVSTAYESGNASILKASDVVSDALGRGTIFLTDTAGVTATSFSMPEYAPDGLRTPREHINAVNAYHAWRAQVTVDRRLVFQAQPTSPLFEAGEWSGCEISDASMNDGDEIYSRCVVEANGPDGTLLRTERTQAQQAGSYVVISASSPAVANPSFDTDASSWSVTTGSFARTTTAGQYDTAPGGGNFFGANGLSDDSVRFIAATSGTFKAGTQYALQFRCRVGSGSEQLRCWLGGVGDSSRYGVLDFVATNSFQTFTAYWTPTVDSVAPSFHFALRTGAAPNVYIDTLVLLQSYATLVDRRGFRRTKILPVSSAMTSAAAQQIADTYLANHRYTPYRGSLTVTGQGGIRTHTGGQGIHPADLLLYTQEKVRLTNRINPDDGSVGRDGTIASVSYDHNTNTASVELDNRTSHFESFLERLALLTGQVR